MCKSFVIFKVYKKSAESYIDELNFVLVSWDSVCVFVIIGVYLD